MFLKSPEGGVCGVGFGRKRTFEELATVDLAGRDFESNDMALV